jgi:hypothetical protein
MDHKELDYLLKHLPVNNNKKIISANQSTNDIIQAIIKQHISNRKDAKNIAKYFQADNARDTAYNIFEFCKKNIPYKVESGFGQSVKTLGRILYDAKNGTGYNDCKAYATFAGNICEALQIPFVYRFAGYKGKDLTHTYCVVKSGENEIVIDPVLSYFDTEKPYKNKVDKKIMALYQVSGIPEEQGTTPNITDNFYDTRGTSVLANYVAGDFVAGGDFVGVTKAGKILRKVASGAKKAVQAVKTVSLTIPRNAFLLLVKENVFGLGTKIKQLNDKKGFAGLEFWYKLGGDRTALQKNANEGAGKKRIFGFEEEMTTSSGTLGVVDPITASVASASPIIIIVKQVLKDAGVLDEKEAVNYGELAKKAGEAYKGLTGSAPQDVRYVPSDNGSTSTTLSASDIEGTKNARGGIAGALPIIALGLGAYFLLKKK